MSTITDDFMKQMIGSTKNYTVVILKIGPGADRPDAMQVIWEHARRNFELRADGTLPIVCPVRDGTDVQGIGIFTTDEDETRKLMDEDPAVKEGVFIYEVHSARSFPGDKLI
jgi:hypothetical protein